LTFEIFQVLSSRLRVGTWHRKKTIERLGRLRQPEPSQLAARQMLKRKIFIDQVQQILFGALDRNGDEAQFIGPVGLLARVQSDKIPRLRNRVVRQRTLQRLDGRSRRRAWT
jgi:hypothetical protein